MKGLHKMLFPHKKPSSPYKRKYYHCIFFTPFLYASIIQSQKPEIYNVELFGLYTLYYADLRIGGINSQTYVLQTMHHELRL